MLTCFLAEMHTHAHTLVCPDFMGHLLTGFSFFFPMTISDQGVALTLCPPPLPWHVQWSEMKASRFMKLSNITRRLTLKTLTGVEAADADHFSFRRAGSLPEFGHACDSKWWTASTQQLSILLTNHLSLHEADTLVCTQCVWNHTSISFELLFPCQTTSWGCILCDATVAQKKALTTSTASTSLLFINLFSVNVASEVSKALPSGTCHISVEGPTQGRSRVDGVLCS